MSGKTCILGIDPGLDGALCRYDPRSGDLAVFDMPTVKVKKAKGFRRMLAVYELARIVDDMADDVEAVFLEQSWPRNTDGAIAGFGFGLNYGLIYGICAANFLRVELISPQAWKRELRLTGDKNASRAKAVSYFPAHQALFARCKDDGRAEASLIAYCGSRRLLRAAA